MHRIHIEDLEQMVDRGHFAYLKKWLARHNAVIVKPDDVQIPNNFMPGNFTSRPGRWEEDEPLPPYGGYRKLYEDAVANPLKPLPAEADIDWKPIDEIPENRKDGRPMLIRTYFGERKVRRARCHPESGHWLDVPTDGILLAVESWADDQSG
jgi:hypothetical protein